MKKIIPLLAALIATQAVAAQTIGTERTKQIWIDLLVAQHTGLNNWSDTGYANDGFPSASITEIRSTYNFYPIKIPLGIFVDLGVGIMPAPNMRRFDLDRMPVPDSDMQYYLREMETDAGRAKVSARFKMALGLCGDFRMSNRVNIMPYVGVGGLVMPRRSYEMILKEEGTNNQYRTTYVWGVGTDEYDPDSQMLGNLTGRVIFKYGLKPKLSILLGLEYTHFFNTLNFGASFINTFNANIQRSLRVDGNNMNMLGISLGVAFR